MSEGVEQRLDEFSKALAEGHSRRGVLKLGLGLVAGAITASITGRAARAVPPEDPGIGSDECAHACSTLFPPPRHGNERARCLAICKEDCARDPTRICALGGDPIRCCPSGTACCGTQGCCPTSTPLCCPAPATGSHCCPAGTACCGTTACCPPGQNCCPAQNRCVTCSPPRFFNPTTCGCDCPAGTTPCGPVNCCPPGQICSGGTCVPQFCPAPGQNCRFTPCPPGCRCVSTGGKNPQFFCTT
jgi:hypothetical protein